MRLLTLGLLFAGFLSLGCGKPNNPAPATNSPTNTGVNVRDQNAPPGREPITGQDENPEDVKRTAEIRRRVVAEPDFGVNARNVKIMTSKGAVLLRGPVDKASEKEKIVSIAKEVAGAGNVTDELDVVNAPVNKGTPENPLPADPNAPKLLPPVTPPVVPPTTPPVPAPAPGTEPPTKPEVKSL